MVIDAIYERQFECDRTADKTKTSNEYRPCAQAAVFGSCRAASEWCVVGIVAYYFCALPTLSPSSFVSRWTERVGPHLARIIETMADDSDQSDQEDVEYLYGAQPYDDEDDEDFYDEEDDDYDDDDLGEEEDDVNTTI